MTKTGQCRCGELRFEVAGAPLLTGACHCHGCQRMTGGAYSLTSTYPADSFKVVAGTSVIGGTHGAEAQHHHCDRCKSWVFTRPSGMDMVNVRTPMLDDPPAAPPFVESQTAEGFAWARTGATHSYERFPAMEDYAKLMAEFAASAPLD